MKFKNVVLIILGIVAISANANVNYNISSEIQSNSTKSSQVSDISHSLINVNTILTEELLDYLWNHRENLNNQVLIANYLMTQPHVPNQFAVAWKTARLVYFIGNYGAGEKRFVSSKEGAQLFYYGANAGKIAIALDKQHVEGYYWYAIDLGSYGLAKGILSAAANASDGMKALETALNIEPQYHWYGSSRILGRYYQELPGIFGGSSKKALNLFLSASSNSPDFVNNWVFLGNYYLSKKQYQKALAACEKAISTKILDGEYEEERFRREANRCIEISRAKLN